MRKDRELDLMDLTDLNCSSLANNDFHPVGKYQSPLCLCSAFNTFCEGLCKILGLRRESQFEAVLKI